MEICDATSCSTCDGFSCSPCRQPFIFLFIIVLFIAGYYLYLKNSYGTEMASFDFMNKKVINVCQLENCCSWWPISHFILFFILGFLFPHCWAPLIALGILWEIIEVIMGKMVVGDGWKRQATRDGENIEYSSNWWQGSFKDIFMDIAGFTVGFALAAAMGRVHDL